MHNTILYITTLFIILFSLGCTKELANEEILFFDYSLTSEQPLEQELASNETVSIVFELEETTGNSEYTLTYTSSNEGTLTNGEEVFTAGEAIQITPGALTFSYSAGALGVHKLTFTVNNANRTPIQKEIVFTLNFGQSIIDSDRCATPNINPLDGYIPTEIKVEEVTAVCNLMDGNLSTYWNLDGEEVRVQLDLGEKKITNQIQLGFFEGDTKMYNFDVQVSDDKETWTTVLQGSTSVSNLELQTFTFPNQEARYVQYVGRGNSVDLNNGLTEVTIGVNNCTDLKATKGLIATEIIVNKGFANVCNLMDGDLETEWSANGENAWVQFDLGARRSFNTIQLAFSETDTKIYTFDIQASDDLVVWEDLSTSNESFPNQNLQSFHFLDRFRRYIRFVGHGNSVDQNTALKEVIVTSNNSTLCDIPNPLSGIIPTAIEVSKRSNYNICAIMDRNLETPWAVSGDNEWIQFDLGVPKEINQMQIEFGTASDRSYLFDIQVSSDAVTWQNVISDRSSNFQSGLLDFNFNTQNIRYIRYFGHGFENASAVKGDRNVISEIVLNNTSPTITENTCNNPSPNTGIVPQEVVVSSFTSDSSPCNVMDNNTNAISRWAASGDNQWVYFDFGFPVDIREMKIAFYLGQERVYTFDIQVSQNAVNWTTIVDDAKSAGNTLNLETFTFPVQKTRYIRYLGFRNDFNDFNSLTEVQFQ